MAVLRRLCLALLLVLASTEALLATDLVAKKVTFDPLPRVGRSGRIGLEVTNSGTTPSGTFTVRFTVRFEGNSVYQHTANGTAILAEGSTNVWTPYTFTPARRGIHEVTAEVIYSGETDPTDNTLVGTANPLAGYISRDSAVARLNKNVLQSLATYSDVAAFHLPSASAAPDSVHDAGTVLSFADGTTNTLTTPSYLFYVDLEQSSFFQHATLAVAIPAESGSNDTLVVRQSTLPFLLNGAPITHGSYCGTNPQRVAGNAFACPIAPMFSTETTDNDTTCVLIVTGATLRDVDDATMRHDISSYITRMNSAALGPRITFGSFLVRRGSNVAGITKQELQAEINRLVAVSCRALVVKYIGHSTADGLLLAGNGFVGTEMLSWSEFSALVESVGATDVTVDLTSGGATRALPALRSGAILGTCIASADSAATMPIGRGSGTFWEQAASAAMISPLADTDGDAIVSAAEAARYAISTHAVDDSVGRSNPRVADLNSPQITQNSRISGVTDERWIIPASGQNLLVSAEYFTVATSYKTGSTRRDTSVQGGVVYVDNTTLTDLRADDIYEFVAIGGRGTTRTDSVIARLRPHVGARKRIAVAAIPVGFTGLVIRQATSQDGPTIVVDSNQIVAVSTSSIQATHPSLFRTTLALDNDGESRRYTTTTDIRGNLGSTVRLPATVSSSATTATGIIVSGTVTSAIEGGQLITTLTNTETAARTVLHTSVLRPIAANASTPLPSSLRWNSATVSEGIHTATSVRNSLLTVRSGATVVPDPMSFDAQGSSIEFSGTPTPAISLGDATSDGIRIGGLCITGASKLTIAHRAITMRSLRLGGAALTLKPTAGNHDVVAVGAYGSRGDAITVDLVGDADSYMVYGAHVVRPDNFDVRVTGSGTVHCVDCSVNLPNTIAASGTALHLRQNISAVVTDGTGLPRSGVKIDVVGRSGAVLASAITDAEGFAMLDTVLIGITTNKLVDHRPVTVRMTAADGSTQEQSVITSLWAQVQFRDSTIVSVQDRQSTLPTVRPMPLTTSHAAYVVDERGITSVDIVSITGSIVRHVQGSGTDRVALATQDLAPGAYTVVVTTPTGRNTVPIIVR